MLTFNFLPTNQSDLLGSPTPFINATVITALVTAAVTSTGWFVLKWLDVRGQKLLKRTEYRRTYIEKQIEQFYGPLHSLAWQIVTINHLKHRMLRNRQMGQREREEIEEYFAVKYFSPIHKRVKEILEGKLYLVEGTDVPRSFYDYLEASLQESVQRELWTERHVDTSFIRGLEYPDTLQEGLLRSLKKLMDEYAINVEALTGREPKRPENYLTEEESTEYVA